LGREDVESEDVMSQSVLAGLLVGLFTGGLIGALGVAILSARSQPRSFHDLRVRPLEADADASARASAESSTRGGLLSDLLEAERDTEQGVGRDEDIDREIRELGRRYGMPPKS
jgi:hypothetical protein